MLGFLLVVNIVESTLIVDALIVTDLIILALVDDKILLFVVRYVPVFVV